MGQQVKICSSCGKKNHTDDLCWSVVGYPKSHPKRKKEMRHSRKEEGTRNKEEVLKEVLEAGGTGRGHIIQNLLQMLKQKDKISPKCTPLSR